MQDNGASGLSPQRPIPNSSIRQRPDVTGHDGASDSRPERSVPSRSKQSPKKGLVSAHASTSPAQTVCRPHVVHKLPKPPPSPKKSLKKQPFTEGDRDILLGMYEDIMNIDEARLFEAWEAFANAVSGHFFVSKNMDICTKISKPFSIRSIQHMIGISSG
jgi:hypothetical protein